MFASQPEVFPETPTLTRTSTGTLVSRPRVGISSADRDRKIAQLTEYIKNKGVDIDEYEETYEPKDEFIAEEIIINGNEGEKIEEQPEEINYYYFIGRLNPPHNGHIKALKELVTKANQKGTRPLILLGSGPSRPDGQRRTMDNPIPYELKEAFIRSVLERELPPLPPGTTLYYLPHELGMSTDSRYIIKEMTNAARDIPMFIQEQLEGFRNIPINKINIKHIAGGKDEDATKLKFALDAAANAAKRKRGDAAISAEVEAIEPEISDSEVAMSATKVRKDAYKTIITEPFGFDGWPQIYKNFYGEYAKPIYDAILFPLQNMSPTEQIYAIEQYLETGELPRSITRQTTRQTKPKTKKRNIGGTNRRKHKKYKKKTLKRKRRYIRRQ